MSQAKRDRKALLRDMIEKKAFIRTSRDLSDPDVWPRYRWRWIFDLRAVSMDPLWADAYAESFLEEHADKYPYQVCSTESAGIPLVGAIVARSARTKTPVNGLFIRKGRKKSDLHKVIEGTPNNHPVIIVDDVVNSGNSLGRQIPILEDEGLKLAAIHGVVRFRDMSAYEHLHAAQVPFNTLFSIEDFGEKLLEKKERTPGRPWEVLWRFEGGKPNYRFVNEKSAPAIDEKKVYVGSDNGVLFALNQEDGSVEWQFKCGFHLESKGIFSDPIVHKERVYFGSYDGDVYCLDANTGEKIWNYEDAEWIGASPDIATDRGLLFIGLEFGMWNRKGGIAALSLEDGREVWAEKRMPLHTHCSPLYIRERNMVVIGSNDGVVYAFRASNGSALWRFQTGGGIKSRFAYSPKYDSVVFGSMDGKVYSLSAKKGNLIWSYETQKGIFSTPYIDHEREIVVMPSLDKIVYGLSLKTGEKIWRHFTAGRIFASPAMVNDSIYIGSNDGRLYELDPETGRRLTIFQTSERVVNKIAYNPKTKHFFVPTVGNEIYCLKRTDEETKNAE